MKVITLMLGLCLGLVSLQAQFTAADSLRGALTPLRTCYDVYYYELSVKVNPGTKSLQGRNVMHYRIKQGFNVFQIDLFANMSIDSILHHGRPLRHLRRHNAVFVDFGEMQEPEQGPEDSIHIYYSGKPRAALNAPWDGGFVWRADAQGNPWIGVACEGIGASSWWPNKDHLSDEPDSFRLYCAVPKGLQCIANGQFRGAKPLASDSNYTNFEWFVSYPINNYNVTLNIANYVHFSDTFVSPTDGSKLPLDYYVLPQNLDKAQKQFKQVHGVLKAFELAFDKYPFWNDGYKLIETPYLGMEHQSAIAYGNEYMPGYKGRHPKGIPVDFIILHETGHEWWGNSLSCADHAEMWLHESFTTYMEAIYVEQEHGYADVLRYLQYHTPYIRNKFAILGPLDVNYRSPDSDHYYKGSVILHTLRRSLGNDGLWWSILKDFYREHKISIIRTADFIAYFNRRSGRDYDRVFEQYLQQAAIPRLEYRLEPFKRHKNLRLHYRWQAEVEGFDLPIYLLNRQGQPFQRLEPKTSEWQSIDLLNTRAADFTFEYGLYELLLKN